MPTPDLAVVVDGGRFYRHPTSGVLLPSITTICSAERIPALERWKIRMAMNGLDPADAASSVADHGSAIHDILLESFKAGKCPRSAPPMVRAAWAAVEGLKCKPVNGRWLAELTVFNATDGWAGTADLVCQVGQELVVLDWKTGRGVYGAALMQIAALTRAEIGWVNGEIIPLDIRRGMVVHLAEKGWEAYEVSDAIPWLYKRFLALREVFTTREALETLVKPTKKGGVADIPEWVNGGQKR
jgi:hypothetical protein